MADLHELNTSSGLDTKDIKESKFMMQLSADAVTLRKQIEVLKTKPESKYELAQKEHELRTIEYRLKGHNFGDIYAQINSFFDKNKHLDRDKIEKETRAMIDAGKEVSEFPHLLAVFLVYANEIKKSTLDALSNERLVTKVEAALKGSVLKVTGRTDEPFKKWASEFSKTEQEKGEFPVTINSVKILSEGKVQIDYDFDDSLRNEKFNQSLVIDLSNVTKDTKDEEIKSKFQAKLLSEGLPQAIAKMQGKGPTTVLEVKKGDEGKKGETGLDKKQIEYAIAYNKKYSNEQIKQIQKKIDPKNDSPNGLNDAAFIESVRAWQALNGLKLDGKVGPATLKALEVKFNKTTKNEKGESTKKESSNSQSNKSDEKKESQKKDESKPDIVKKPAKAKEKATEQPQLPDYVPKYMKDDLKTYPLITLEEFKKYTGEATFVYSNGTYQGNFINGERGGGYGRYKYDDGDWYSGYWEKNQQTNGKLFNGDSVIKLYDNGKGYAVSDYAKQFPEKAIAKLLNEEVGTSFVYDVNLSNITSFNTGNSKINGKDYFIQIIKSTGEINLKQSGAAEPIAKGYQAVIAKLKDLTSKK